MNKIVPLGDRVLIQLDKREDANKTSSGIILPESQIKPIDTGVVQAVGTSPEIKVVPGQRVQFILGTEISVVDEKEEEADYVLVAYYDLLAIIKD